VNRAVFLDRDGVLNRGVVADNKPFAPVDVGEFELMPGVAESLARLASAGFLLIVVTNQPDVSRGRASRQGIERIHEWMRHHLPLTGIRVCFHDDQDLCACRKPKPGLIIAAAVDYEVQLGRSFMIGDRWRDIGAGKAAGCTTILVNRFPEPLQAQPDLELADLPAAAGWILEGAHK
jgi:D-glycero-D-manno-heptose 1,7-bisphosphate phosphatase